MTSKAGDALEGLLGAPLRHLPTGVRPTNFFDRRWAEDEPGHYATGQQDKRGKSRQHENVHSVHEGVP